jgi:translation elongation factor EF-G
MVIPNPVQSVAIRDKYGIDYETSTPLVAYRETILAPAKASYKHKKQTGGYGQYGEVYLEVEPLPRGGGFEFADKIVGGAIPKNYIPGVEKGVREALDDGAVAGYPVVDVRAAVVFGSYHDVDSSEPAFKIAGRTAFKLAMEQGKPILLESIMDLTVFVDEKYTGDVMRDLNSKRGRVLGMDNLGGAGQVIKAKVPQAELLKYAIELRSVTSGTGSSEMEFSHYEPISGKIAYDVIKETQRRKEEAAKEKLARHARRDPEGERSGDSRRGRAYIPHQRRRSPPCRHRDGRRSKRHLLHRRQDRQPQDLPRRHEGIHRARRPDDHRGGEEAQRFRQGINNKS